MSHKFVALCSAAVGAIYVTGYVVTDAAQPAEANSVPTAPHTAASATTSAKTPSSAVKHAPNAAGGNSSTTGSSNDAPSAAASGGGGTSSTGGAAAPVQVTPKPKTQPMYLDGTYTGSGSNRIGTVQVAVTIKNGKIVSADITGCYTHYPESYIDPVLPNEVVARQSADVDIVSGATLSSQDFADAVNQALSQAKNPNYGG
jgi:uncharacterized protein with FMN-binding domain